MADDVAPGAPGLEPRWTSSAKVGVGAALNKASRVWFTLSHGILDEVYFGRLDWACLRDMGLIVTDGRGFFSEEKRQSNHEVSYIAEGVPAYRLTNYCQQGRYRIEKQFVADPQRDVVLQHTRFVPLQGTLADYRLYALLAPHLGNQGYGNTAWIGDTKGQPMLFAERGSSALALASSAPWLARSAGFAGSSDGWQDLKEHGRLLACYRRAEDGNVALIGEIDLQACAGDFLLALGFGGRPLEAGHHARASILDGFPAALQQYIKEWQDWQATVLRLDELTEDVDRHEHGVHPYHVSTAVMRIHQAKEFVGGTIASLSIPWGSAKGDNDLGGYHLVWTRDLVESVGGLMAAGAQGDAGRVLRYLQVTQEDDGHWTQNMWLDGTPYWTGVQMDETAFPIMLTSTAWREGILDKEMLAGFWPMVLKAASYVVRNGPVTGEDRWEENAGYTPFTLAVEIAGLLAAAELADLADLGLVATYLRETADSWNANIERWTYVTHVELASRYGVDGYYVRISPPDADQGSSLPGRYVEVKNRPPQDTVMPAAQIVSADALALVRFGLRSPHDPRILNTIKVIDAVLKVDTRYGPVWHRYNDDGYGEHADGSPFDGTGIGRCWPLLTGERAHYELAAGNVAQAAALMHAMESFANDGGMIPEQIWDAPDMPDKELFFGKPSGSAMPLVWAHAEYVKLRRSLREGRVFDMPPQTVQRYLVDKTPARFAGWRFNQKVRSIPAGRILRVEILAPGRVHWSADNWQTAQDTDARDTGLGIYVADIPTAGLAPGASVAFTLYWPQANHWEGTDFTVAVEQQQDWTDPG